MPAPIDFAGRLSAEQLAAVTHDGGPLAVLAGPGTGKTRVLTHRIAHLVRERAVEPETVLAVTFTNRAAEEMRERLAELLSPGEAERLSVGTFHALALRTLRRFADRADLPPEPMLTDSAQRRRLMRELLIERPLSPAVMAPGVASAADHALTVLAQLRHAAIGPAEALARAQAVARSPGAADGSEDPAAAAGRRAGAARLAEICTLLVRFDRACAQRGWLGLDDLIPRAADLLAHDEFVGPMVRGRLRSVLVDEFQDVNLAQVRLLEALCPPRSRPDLCVVGDDDQAIYAFRGADDRALARFEAIWTPVTVRVLTENRRSSAPVVAVASSVIQRAGERFRPDKQLRAAGSETVRTAERDHGPGSVLAVRLDTKQKTRSAEHIADLLWQDRRAAERAGRAPLPWSGAAVIARGKTELSRVRAHLELAAIPVRSQERDSPMDDEGVQDVLAWARLLVDPTLGWAAQRLLTRAPSSVEFALVGEWGSLFRAARENARLGAPEAPAAPPSFAAWLRGHLGAGAPPGGLRFCRLFEELGTVTTDARADEAIMEIVRRTGAASAELLAPAARARRVTALASLVRFARSRLARFDEPRGLAAMLEYLDLLDESERQSLEDPAGRVESDGQEPADGAADAGAVTLVTAHSAKGLEFDTVYLPGTHPGGYPPSAGQADDPLPAWLLADELAAGRDARQRRADEERRVFYVACTRAQRRLVLVGSTPKKVTTQHFLAELLDRPEVDWIEAEEVVAGDSRRDELEAMQAEFRAREEHARAADRAREEARALAAAALVRAEELPGPPEDAAERAAEAVWRMALVGAVERTGAAPAWASERGLADLAERLLAGRAAAADHGVRFAPLKGPLQLSYTLIDAYRRCPACCYLQRIVEWPEPTGEPLILGRVVHEALQAFYDRWRSADSEGAEPPGAEALAALGRASFFRVWGQEHPAGVSPDEAPLLQALAQLSVLWERLHDPGAHISEVEVRVRMPWVHRGRHRFEMKLDRVDLVGGGVRIIDYKTGGARKALTDRKELSRDLQMGLYVRGLRHLREDAELGGVCEYWILSEGVVGRIGFDEIDHARVESEINGAIDGMLDGVWTPARGCRGLCAELGIGAESGPEEG